MKINTMKATYTNEEIEFVENIVNDMVAYADETSIKTNFKLMEDVFSIKMSHKMYNKEVVAYQVNDLMEYHESYNGVDNSLGKANATRRIKNEILAESIEEDILEMMKSKRA